MTQLTEEHFEIHDANKDRINQYRIADKLERRIATLEKSLASANILIGKLQQRLDVLVSATEEWSNL
jgi:hypothetical protein|tara:strand:+ start:693 stop:893 length:201 start_codon:yes stop_codon:yes gene_type:complete